MKAYEKILCGVDFSSASKAALQEAARISRVHKSRLFVVSIIPQDIAAKAKHLGMTPEKLIQAREAKLKEFIELSVPILGEIDFSEAVVIGYPFKELISQASLFDADLLVIGTTGESDSEENSLGGLASRCVQAAPTEVLLVRPSEIDGFKKVIVAVDFSETSHRAIRRAAALAKVDGGLLHLVHVFTLPQNGLSLDLDRLAPPDDNIRKQLAETQKRTGEFIRDALSEFEGIPTTIEIVENVSKGAGIVGYILKTKADLAVLGTAGPPCTYRIGSTAQYIIHDAPCSVLTLQPESKPR